MIYFSNGCLKGDFSSVNGVEMKEKLKKLLPKAKKSVSSFIIEEKGAISKHKMLSLGAFLGTASILSLLPEVFHI